MNTVFEITDFASRYVYADWLEEKGLPNKAAIFRKFARIIDKYNSCCCRHRGQGFNFLWGRRIFDNLSGHFIVTVSIEPDRLKKSDVLIAWIKSIDALEEFLFKHHDHDNFKLNVKKVQGTRILSLFIGIKYTV